MLACSLNTSLKLYIFSSRGAVAPTQIQYLIQLLASFKHVQAQTPVQAVMFYRADCLGVHEKKKESVCFRNAHLKDHVAVKTKVRSADLCGRHRQTCFGRYKQAQASFGRQTSTDNLLGQTSTDWPVWLHRHYPEGIMSFKENLPGVQGAA